MTTERLTYEICYWVNYQSANLAASLELFTRPGGQRLRLRIQPPGGGEGGAEVPACPPPLSVCRGPGLSFPAHRLQRSRPVLSLTAHRLQRSRPVLPRSPSAEVPACPPPLTVCRGPGLSFPAHRLQRSRPVLPRSPSAEVPACPPPLNACRGPGLSSPAHRLQRSPAHRLQRSPAQRLQRSRPVLPPLTVCRVSGLPAHRL